MICYRSDENMNNKEGRLENALVRSPWFGEGMRGAMGRVRSWSCRFATARVSRVDLSVSSASTPVHWNSSPSPCISSPVALWCSRFQTEGTRERPERVMLWVERPSGCFRCCRIVRRSGIWQDRQGIVSNSLRIRAYFQRK